MLRGAKVILRAMTRADMDRLCTFNNDVEVELAGGGDPPLPQSLERLLAQFDAGLAQGGRDGSVFAIEADGKFIGQAVLHSFSETHRTCELGITIGDKTYWGKGYGRDAVRLLLEHAFRHRNMNRVFLSTLGNNERALSCYRACGFQEEGRLRQHAWSDGAYQDLVYMGVLRSEWEAQQ